MFQGQKENKVRIIFLFPVIISPILSDHSGVKAGGLWFLDKVES